MDVAAIPLLRGLDERLARGVVAGIAAGLAFLLANMWYADSRGLPAVAPLYDISTIFYLHRQARPRPRKRSRRPDRPSRPLCRVRGGAGRIRAALRLGPLAGGRFGDLWLLLYLVNFQILGRLVFEWFQEGPNQTFKVFAHIGYGLLLAPFLAGYSGAGEGVRVGGRAQPAGRRVVPD